MLDLLILRQLSSLDKGVKLGTHWRVRSLFTRTILWLGKLASTDRGFFFLSVVESFFVAGLCLNIFFHMAVVRKHHLLVLERHGLDLSYYVRRYCRNRLVIFFGYQISLFFFLTNPFFMGQKMFLINQSVSVSWISSVSRRVLHRLHVELTIIRAVLL